MGVCFVWDLFYLFYFFIYFFCFSGGFLLLFLFFCLFVCLFVCLLFVCFVCGFLGFFLLFLFTTCKNSNTTILLEIVSTQINTIIRTIQFYPPYAARAVRSIKHYCLPRSRRPLFYRRSQFVDTICNRPYDHHAEPQTAAMSLFTGLFEVVVSKSFLLSSVCVLPVALRRMARFRIYSELL